jgi:hypothetical protein
VNAKPAAEPMRKHDESMAPERAEDRPGKHWNWIHFAAGFVPVALVVFFDTGMPFFSTFWPHAAETIVVGTIAGMLTACFGEAAFEWILRQIR